MPAVFRSALASRLQAFWDMRRLAGQQGLTTLKILRYLDRFLVGELLESTGERFHAHFAIPSAKRHAPR
jgi:hypothetical protein